ncbi:MAG: MotA/TolQ/ExbB proton channel family protein [Nitrospirae bacterium]|nr:MotA/TolQ/ExbB proton channel family protein [Nitrospirota bacterium]
MVDLILTASYITLTVLIILLFFSIFSWAGIFYKFRVFSRVKKATRLFLHDFKKGEDPVALKKGALRHKESPLAMLYLGSLKRLQRKGILSDQLEIDIRHETTPEPVFRNLGRVLKTIRNEELVSLESYLSYFAIIGNISPFIGLFGTVLGIIDAFQNISQIGSANIAAVAPGVAEALVATAAGLLTAIPAVIAYNYFLNSLRIMDSQMEGFSEELILFFEEHSKTSTQSHAASK